MIRLAIDMQGADRPATELIGGVIEALNKNSDLQMDLFGDEKVLGEALSKEEYDRSRLTVINAPDTVTNHDNPASVISAKPESSLVKGMQACRESGEYAAFVSCGATGALFMSALMIIGRLPHMKPVLVCELIKLDGSPVVISDCGANVDCAPAMLLDFAKMGRAYMRSRGVEEPKIAMLSNGAEDSKGNGLVKEANAILREKMPGFIGNIEGTDVLTGDADVIVCEGFAGNILLKTIEGSAKAALAGVEKLSAGLDGEAREKVLALTAEIYKRYDYNALGGAIMLGTAIPVVKGHGSANAQTMCSIIDIAYRLGTGRITEKLTEGI